MDSIRLTRVLIRLFAVFVVAWTVSTAPWIFTNYVVAGNEGKSALYFISAVLLPVFFPIIAAIGLWVFAGTISGKLNPEDEQFSIDGFSEEKAFTFGLFFLGVFIFFYASVDLVAHLTYVYLQLTTNDHSIEAITTYPDLIATIFELVLGAIIALQRKGLVYLVQKIRGRSEDF